MKVYQVECYMYSTDAQVYKHSLSYSTVRLLQVYSLCQLEAESIVGVSYELQGLIVHQTLGLLALDALHVLSHFYPLVVGLAVGIDLPKIQRYFTPVIYVLLPALNAHTVPHWLLKSPADLATNGQPFRMLRSVGDFVLLTVWRIPQISLCITYRLTCCNEAKCDTACTCGSVTCNYFCSPFNPRQSTPSPSPCCLHPNNA